MLTQPDGKLGLGYPTQSPNSTPSVAEIDDNSTQPAPPDGDNWRTCRSESTVAMPNGDSCLQVLVPPNLNSRMPRMVALTDEEAVYKFCTMPQTGYGY